jgi:hypothetical protein
MDSLNCAEGKNYYVIFSTSQNENSKKYQNLKKLKTLKKGCKYSSDVNPNFFSIIQLRKLLKKYNYI